MRVLIQQISTGWFFGKARKWVNNPAEALAFLNEIRARDYSIYHQFTDVKVVSISDLNLEKVIPKQSREAILVSVNVK